MNDWKYLIDGFDRIPGMVHQDSVKARPLVIQTPYATPNVTLYRGAVHYASITGHFKAREVILDCYIRDLDALAVLMLDDSIDDPRMTWNLAGRGRFIRSYLCVAIEYVRRSLHVLNSQFRDEGALTNGLYFSTDKCSELVYEDIMKYSPVDGTIGAAFILLMKKSPHYWGYDVNGNVVVEHTDGTRVTVPPLSFPDASRFHTIISAVTELFMPINPSTHDILFENKISGWGGVRPASDGSDGFVVSSPPSEPRREKFMEMDVEF